MKLGFYCRLAFINLRNNRRTYGPYLLSSAVVTMMYFVLHQLAYSRHILEQTGGAAIQSMLLIAFGIVGLFSVLFLFYTNSFLIKRRKREFGMFNILGMQKSHIARVLFWETLLVGAASMAAGILGGALFSKLFEALLMRALHLKASLAFELDISSVQATVIVYGCIDLALFLCSVWELHLNNPAALLRDGRAGEKPPKSNWVVALLGLLTLGGGYFIAVTVREPLAALLLFFVAVALVMIGTFCLFTAGSVTFLRLLSKNKNYYYKTAHFVSVSGMIARMRRNGAGLASICILSTAVLVTVSSTVSLYLGSEDVIRQNNPRNVSVSLPAGEENQRAVDAAFAQALRAENAEPDGELNMTYLSFAVVDRDGVMAALPPQEAAGFDSVVRSLTVEALSDYNRVSGQSRMLADDEAMLYVPSGYGRETITVGDRVFRVAARLEDSQPVHVGSSTAIAVESFFLVVPDAALNWMYDYQAGIYGENRSEVTYWYGVDLDLSGEAKGRMVHALREALRGRGATVSSDAESREAFYTIYGVLFFLGLFLGSMFLLAMVLILYYKQVTEGYEDQSRFEIMRKVGMTREEIKKTVRSQTVTVFFLPLLAAGVHMVFAFPVVRRLLVLLSMSNTALFALGTLGTFLVFAVLYLIVYHWTSGAYYSIVSRDGQRGVF